MAHELDMSNGRANFAYVGEAAWHGLGHELEPGQPIEVWKTTAGMDWEIKRTPARWVDEDTGETHAYNEKHVLYRSDTKAGLSVVSQNYKIVQPGEVLEFYRDLVGVADMQLETAGVLFGGRRFWALANTGRLAELKGDDTVKGFLLLSTSCDGTLATTVQFTSVRVVCNNTLSIATRENNTGKIRIPHNRVWNPNEAKEQLGLIDSSWSKFKEQISRLADVTVERDKGVEFLLKLFGDQNVELESQSPAVTQRCANVWSLYAGQGMGAGLEAANGTWWGLLNAVTETIDHHTGHRTADAAMNNAWFGNGAATKTHALELALDYAEVA